MKYNFIGHCNKEIPNTIVWDEEEHTWRVLVGGLLKMARYKNMQDAALAVEHVVDSLTMED